MRTLRKGSINPVPHAAEVGARLTATLADPDKASGRVSWQWYRGVNADTVTMGIYRMI